MITALIRVARKITSIMSILIITVSCQQFSEKETDQAAGLNGSFEISKNNLPVNWLMYTPNTVPDADFKIVLDQSTYKDGQQSLRFDVNSCASTGGWASPGFTNEFFDVGKYEGAGTYKLSFWIKNDGSKFRVGAGGVSPLEGNMKTLIESEEQLNEWKLFEYNIIVPKENHLRMEFNVLQAGTLWIDDVKITRI